MKNMNKFNELLENCPLIAILRGITPDSVIEVCELLVECGIGLIEVPLNSPDAIESIKRAAKHFASGNALIGAGTVLTVDDVDAVADAGGAYIISPDTNHAVIKRTKEFGLISSPGFLTPSEAFSAIAAGADVLKCFPVGTMGSDYIKNLKAVVKKPIIAVGGVDLNNAKEFLTQTAGLGIGSALYKPGKSLEQIKSDTTAFIAACRK